MSPTHHTGRLGDRKEVVQSGPVLSKRVPTGTLHTSTALKKGCPAPGHCLPSTLSFTACLSYCHFYPGFLGGVDPSLVTPDLKPCLLSGLLSPLLFCLPFPVTYRGCLMGLCVPVIGALRSPIVLWGLHT